MRKVLITVAAALLFVNFHGAVFAASLERAAPSDAGSFSVADNQRAAPVLIDSSDYSVVKLSANLFADDVKRITGMRPSVGGNVPTAPAQTVIIAGTLGRSKFVDTLARAGRLKRVGDLKNKWEATLAQIVERPFPGVDRALVLVGSDRRGTAYGLMQLSETLGVSPWNWWADVPVHRQIAVSLKAFAPNVDTPGVKYRGIFINDEDWGLAPWAKKTLDPTFGNVGPKTYEKVFELMLRLRLNYLWPAMHGCSKEFGSVPENVALADKYAIVMGASHCEPMLYNNVKWPVKEKGDWNYQTNRTTIYDTWETTAKERGRTESVWTLGIRGIHDRGMNGPKEMPGRIDLVSKVIGDQRGLLEKYVTNDWGPVAQCFVPYKEVQPIYDAGLEVPPDVTLVWADDNFGYLRRLSSPKERKRPGGAGFYYHLSYYGTPHSYTWINTTPPALMWEEMHKAWQNEARTIWVVNVGDIKPMEIGIDYLSKLSWNPDAVDANTQPVFLRDFAAKQFGEAVAQPVADLLGEYYRLGTVRKPELMNRAWAGSRTPEQSAQLRAQYRALLEQEKAVSDKIAPESRDAYTELVGYSARVFGTTGLLFLADRAVQRGEDATANQAEVERLHAVIDAETRNYNEIVAGSKWNFMMSGPNTAAKSTDWSSLVRWPWYEKAPKTEQPNTVSVPAKPSPDAARKWQAASTYQRKTGQGKANWASVTGLGQTGTAMVLQPATLQTSWTPEAKGFKSPCLEYDFLANGSDAEALVDFLPTFRIYPGMKLRVAVAIDNSAITPYEVPGSSGSEDENGRVRRMAVQDNIARLRVPLSNLSPGKHTFKIYAVDPGAVIDRVSLPQQP